MSSKSFAADGVTPIISVPGHELMVSAAEFNRLYQRLSVNHQSLIADTLPGSLVITMHFVVGNNTVYEQRILAKAEWNSMLVPNQLVGSIAIEMEAEMQRRRIELQGH